MNDIDDLLHRLVLVGLLLFVLAASVLFIRLAIDPDAIEKTHAAETRR